MRVNIARKKRGLTRSIWLDYYGRDRLHLSDTVIDEIMAEFSAAYGGFLELIHISFLPDAQKEIYRSFLEQRGQAFGLWS